MNKPEVQWNQKFMIVSLQDNISFACLENLDNLLEEYALAWQHTSNCKRRVGTCVASANHVLDHIIWKVSVMIWFCSLAMLPDNEWKYCNLCGKSELHSRSTLRNVPQNLWLQWLFDLEHCVWLRQTVIAANRQACEDTRTWKLELGHVYWTKYTKM